MRFHKTALFAAVISGLVLASAYADKIQTGTGTNLIPPIDVTVTGIEGDKLIYQTSNGSRADKSLTQVAQITVTGEQAFNDAEQAFRDGKFDDAVSSYQKAVQSTTKSWVKARSALRLVEAAQKVNRFDAAATAFIALAQVNPETASKSKPVINESANQYLDNAAISVNKVLDQSSKLTTQQRSVLLSFLLEIDRAKKDIAGAKDVLSQLDKLGGLSPADAAAVKLSNAELALDQKNFQAAADAIQKNRALFNDPAQQVDALAVIAQAQDGLNGNSDDASVLKDLAIAYMRVVTFGKDLTGQPHVAESLLRVAQIEEKLKEPKVAVQIYQQIGKDFADRPAAVDAKAGLERLKGT